MSVPSPSCRIVAGSVYREAGKYLFGWREQSYDADLDLYTLVTLIPR